MELFNENIEQRILTKEYFELSPSEREQIKDFISNEEEYLQFRTTLLMAADIQTENIKPKADTKASLMSMMEPSRPERKIWYNSIGLFLFPEDKPAYAKPGVYASIAAILILAFVFVPMDFSISNKDSNVAANEDKMSSDDVKELNPATEEAVASELEPTNNVSKEIVLEQNKDLDKLKKEDAEFEVGDNEVLHERVDGLDENIGYFVDGNANGGENIAIKKEGQKNEINSLTIDYAAGVYNKGNVAEKNNLADSTLTNIPAPGYKKGAVFKDARYKENPNNYISGDLKKDGFAFETVNDNALNQIDDLIDLLYTAD